MESKGGGKIPRKRTRLTAKPYSRASASSTRETSSTSGHRSGADTNQSLLQRVSSSLLGFVTPSWLTGYWSSSQDKQEPARATERYADTPPPTEPTYDDNEDDRPQDEVDAEMEGVAVTQSVENKGTPFSSQQPLGTSTPVDDFNNRFKVCTDDASDVSMATSSVSMIPQVDNTDYQNKVSGSNTSKDERPSAAKQWTRTDTTTPRTGSRPQQPGRNLQKPSFNSSYFGSPLTGRESPVGPFASPFYPGRTAYGGASSTQRSTSTSNKPSNSPYQVYHPIRRRVKPRQASTSMNSGFGVTSAAAKQILETLEKMSTPLSDAKKIPLSPTASPLVFDKRARTSLRTGPPVAPRPVPTHASVASTRQTSLLTEEAERPRKLATSRKEVEVATPSTAKFSVQSTFKYGVPNSIPLTPASRPSTAIPQVATIGSGGGGKMKSKKKSAVHVSNKEDEENEMLEEVDLPNIALPLAKGKMPLFNFAVPSSKSTFMSSTFMSTSQSSKPATSTPTMLSKPDLQFQFSSPIFKEGLAAASESGKTFTFSSPKPAGASFSSPSTPSSKRKETKNEQEDVSFGGGLQPAKELKKGSCLEFLGIVPSKSSTGASENNKKQIIGFGDKFKKEPGTWNCSMCLLDNKPSAKTCIACTTAKPKASNASVGLKQDSVDSSVSISLSGTLSSSKTCTTHLKNSNSNRTSSAQIGFGDKFKPEAGSWNCSACLLNNKPDRDTCIACAGPRPQTTNAIKPQISLAEKFKPQEGTWTCETCLVDNKKESLKCVACTAAKPGATSQSSSLGVSKPSISSNVDLSHLKPPPDNWTCLTCLISNRSSASKCVACASEKPNTAQKQQSSISLREKLAPPAGSWSCDTCLVQNKSTDSKCVACSSAKPASASGSTTSLLDKFAPPPGSWTCDTCLIQNKSLDVKCVACGSAKPGSKPESKPKFGFGDKFKAAPGSWTCDTCLIQNQKSSRKCLACGASQPGSEPILKAPPASAFKFGGTLPQSSSNETTSSTFKFGGTAPPSTGGFTFGAMSEQSKPVTGGFTFGKQSAESSKISAITKTSSTTTDTVNQSGKSTEPAAFQFGKTSSSEKSQPSGGFTFGQKSEKAPVVVSGGFSFGQSSATNSTEKPTNSTLNTGSSLAAAGGFSFGNAASTTANTGSSSTFVFGAKSNDTNSPAKIDGIGSQKGITKEASSSAFQPSAGFTFGSKNASDNKDAGSVFGGTSKVPGNVTVNNNDVNKSGTAVAFQFGAATETKSSTAFGFSSGQTKESSAKPSTTFSFGKKPAQDEGPPAKVGGFSFGNDKSQEPASTTNTCSLPAFTFGAKPTAAPAASTAEPASFKFRQNPSPTPPAFGGFGAAVNNSTAPALTNSVNSTTSGFNFNSSSSNNGGGGFNFNSSSNAVPKFGATSSTPTFGAAVNPVAPVPTFSGQSNSTIGSSGFGIGSSNSVAFGGAGANNPPAPAFGSTAPQTNGPGGFQFNSGSNTKTNAFQFGQQNNATSVFQFGAKNADQSTPAPSSGFNFGSTPATQTNNFGSSPAPQPNNFGSSPAPQPNNFGGFAAPSNDSAAYQFKSGPATNDNPFNAVSSGMQGRKIKRAQRRIKKT